MCAVADLGHDLALRTGRAAIGIARRGRLDATDEKIVAIAPGSPGRLLTRYRQAMRFARRLHGRNGSRGKPVSCSQYAVPRIAPRGRWRAVSGDRRDPAPKVSTRSAAVTMGSPAVVKPRHSWLKGRSGAAVGSCTFGTDRPPCAGSPYVLRIGQDGARAASPAPRRSSTARQTGRITSPEPTGCGGPNRSNRVMSSP